MLVTKEDIKFIADKTKLSIRGAKSLTEEESDLNLVLNELSTRDINPEELSKLSFQVIARLIVFKFSKESNISIQEKTHVAKQIIQHFPTIARNKLVKSIPKKINLDFAHYSLILTGFFSHRLQADDYVKYRDCLKSLLEEEYTRDLYHHLDEWFRIFNKIKTDESFI